MQLTGLTATPSKAATEPLLRNVFLTSKVATDNPRLTKLPPAVAQPILDALAANERIARG